MVDGLPSVDGISYQMAHDPFKRHGGPPICYAHFPPLSWLSWAGPCHNRPPPLSKDIETTEALR